MTTKRSLRTLYHFTSEFHLSRILADGGLRTTDPNLFSTGPLIVTNLESGERVNVGGEILGPPVVWFFDTPEVLAGGRGLIGSAVDKRVIRITVEVDDGRPWLDWLKLRKHDPCWVRVAIDVGGGERAARHWYVVARPVLRDEWIEIREWIENDE